MEANLRAVNKNVDLIFTEVIFRANNHLVFVYRDTCQASNLLFEFKSPNVCRRHGMKTPPNYRQLVIGIHLSPVDKGSVIFSMPA